MVDKEGPYGFELIMDLHGCDVGTFNRESLDEYFEKVCEAIDMTRCKLEFWDDVGVPVEQQQTAPHTKGTTAVQYGAKPMVATQFILTSNITVHTLELLKAAYVNIFSCKTFDKKVAEEITKQWFGADECRTHFIERI
ncbi:MAG: S-adenosylmethionine decarboxylase [Planctomycetota bacterium]|jgi:S-adenosylmethionine/arginine decarboxylase-like enzyme